MTHMRCIAGGLRKPVWGCICDYKMQRTEQSTPQIVLAASACRRLTAALVTRHLPAPRRPAALCRQMLEYA